MQVIDAQRILSAQKIDVGPVDGIMGPRTRKAIRLFQIYENLEMTGVLDRATSRALAAKAGRPVHVSHITAPPWHEAADRLKGTKEISGPKSNPVIMRMAEKLGGWIAGWYKDDDIPWCGLFVAHCITATLPDEPIPSNPLSARAWSDFGRDVRPCLGAVLVFKRSGGGHVGFYVGEDADAYHVLGGNQSNSVNVTRVAKSRLLATRWPSSGPEPRGGRITLSPVKKLSRNEA